MLVAGPTYMVKNSFSCQNRFKLGAQHRSILLFWWHESGTPRHNYLSAVPAARKSSAVLLEDNRGPGGVNDKHFTKMQ